MHHGKMLSFFFFVESNMCFLLGMSRFGFDLGNADKYDEDEVVNAASSFAPMFNPRANPNVVDMPLGEPADVTEWTNVSFTLSLPQHVVQRLQEEKSAMNLAVGQAKGDAHLLDAEETFRVYVCGNEGHFEDLEMERQGNGNEWHAQGKVHAFSRIAYRYAFVS
jgi:hypothetical protein